MRVVALAIALVMMLGGPAAAGTPQDPEFSDPCGLGPHVAKEQVLPWLDVCGIWFETLSAPDEAPAIRVTMEVDSHLADRTDSIFSIWWRAGGCGFGVQRYDGGTEVGPGDPVAVLSAQCAAATRVPCGTPFDELGFGCVEIPDPVQYELGGFTESGDRLSWTIRFEGPLAEYAEHHRDGALLDEPGALTLAAVNGRPLYGGGGCTGTEDGEWDCDNLIGEYIPEGRDYVVGS